VATPRAAVEYALVIAVVVAIQALSFSTQERISVNRGRGYDGSNYYQLAEQFAAGERPTGVSRFARRLGTSFLAAVVAPHDLMTAFQSINACAAFASALLFLAWLRRYVGSWWLRIALVVVYATHWLQLVRFTTYYPVLTDACAQACCFAGLHCIASYENSPDRWKVAAVAAIGIVGVCFREVVLLVPLAFVFARNPGIRYLGRFPYIALANPPRLAHWIPLALAGGALALLDVFVVATDPEFAASDHLLTRALSRSALTYVAGWMAAFGPALFLLLFDWRQALAFLLRHRWLSAYVLGVAAIGWAGSLESERHALNWAAPVVYVLIGHSLQRHCTTLRHSAVLVVIVLAQLLVGRVFWSIPQPADDYRERSPVVLLTALGPNATYLHLFPDYLPRELVRVELLQHAAVGVVILILMQSTAAGRGARLPFAARAGARLRRGDTTTLAAGRASGSGLRQLGPAGALKVLVLAFVATATMVGLGILIIHPRQPVPIHVRWTGEVTGPQRAALERQLQLSAGTQLEGTTWRYLLTDPSTDTIRKIVTHPDVDDTEHLNRVWFRPEFGNDRERRAIFYGTLIGGAGAIAVLLWTGIRRTRTSSER
jgi:hypothetical protein